MTKLDLKQIILECLNESLMLSFVFVVTTFLFNGLRLIITFLNSHNSITSDNLF